jgi:hypothetical protein
MKNCGALELKIIPEATFQRQHCPNLSRRSYYILF